MAAAETSLISDRQLASAVAWCYGQKSRHWDLEQREWHDLCRQFLDRLEPLANQPDQTISYTDLVMGTCLEGRPGWHYIVSDLLEVIVKVCVDAGYPILTALVVRKEERTPSTGFYGAAFRFGRAPTKTADVAFWLQEMRKVNACWKAH